MAETTRTTHVVVGIGNMGLPIARRLVVRGYEAVAVDIAEPRRRIWSGLTGLDARAAVTEVEWSAVAGVFVVVRTTGEVAEVLGEITGGLTGAPARPVFVASTLEAPFAANLGSYATPSVRMLELPISGGETAALAGRLTAMLAGPAEPADIAFLKSTLIGPLVTFERYGQPTVAKLLNNLLGAYNVTALAHMLELARANGISPRQLYEVTLTASGGSWIGAAFPELIDDLLAKDVRLASQGLGSLPPVDLSDVDRFEERLVRARALLFADSG